MAAASPAWKESSLRALTKLQQVLPARLASRVDAFGRTVLPVGPRFGPLEGSVDGTVVVHAPAEVVRERSGGWDITIEPLGTSRCRLGIGGTSLATLAFWLGALGADFEVLDVPQLAEAVRRLAQRYARAA